MRFVLNLAPVVFMITADFLQKGLWTVKNNCAMLEQNKRFRGTGGKIEKYEII